MLLPPTHPAVRAAILRLTLALALTAVEALERMERVSHVLIAVTLAVTVI
jgi:hypothetical protein